MDVKKRWKSIITKLLLLLFFWNREEKTRGFVGSVGRFLIHPFITSYDNGI